MIKAFLIMGQFVFLPPCENNSFLRDRDCYREAIVNNHTTGFFVNFEGEIYFIMIEELPS